MSSLREEEIIFCPINVRWKSVCLDLPRGEQREAPVVNFVRAVHKFFQ